MISLNMRPNNKPISHQRIASERMERLLLNAESNFKEHPKLSQRYIELARKIAMRYKLRFTSEQKRLFCKKCNAYLKNGINSRVRLEHGKISVTCLECGNVKRMVYKKSKKNK